MRDGFDLLTGCPRHCGTCFHALEGGSCSIGGTQGGAPCPWWVPSFGDFLRAVRQWQQGHPGQAPEPSTQGSGARVYNLRRYAMSAEGFFPASCRTCERNRPGHHCQEERPGPCGRWAVCLPFFLYGSYLWRLWSQNAEQEDL